MKLFTPKKEHLQDTQVTHAMDFQISGSENSLLCFKVSPACRPPRWPSRPPRKKHWRMKTFGYLAKLERFVTWKGNNIQYYFSSIKWFLNLKNIMYIDSYWHMCPLWYFHGRSCIPNASCRNLFLVRFRDFPPGFGEPNFEKIVENPKFFAQKKLAPASWRSWNSSPPQNLDPPMKTQKNKLSCVLFFAWKNHQILHEHFPHPSLFEGLGV